MSTTIADDRQGWNGGEYPSLCAGPGWSDARLSRRCPDRVATRPRGDDAGARDLLDVALVGAAAAAEDRQLRKSGDERGVLRAERPGVARVQLGGRVELGMALLRRVGADPPQPTEPRAALVEDVLEVRG